MPSYPLTAWVGAIFTAALIAVLTIMSEGMPQADWARPPESVALVLFFIAPMIVFFALASRED